MKKINKIISIISWIIFILVVLRIFISYNSLPNQLGVHFNPNGDFDVYTNKKDLLLISYPYFMSLIIILSSYGLMFIIDKIKVGFKVTKTGELKLKELVKLMINNTKICFVIYLGVIWGECMIRQINLNVDFMFYYVFLYLVFNFICFIFIFKIVNKYKLKRK